MTPTPWTIREYDLDSWPFPEWLEIALGTTDLTSLRDYDDGPLWKEREDQSSEWHRRLYHSFDRWQDLYEDFIYVVVSRWMDEPFYFQRVPTFRVHLPNNVAVGTIHTDAKYHHPAGETTFWLPCTETSPTSTVDQSCFPRSPLRNSARSRSVANATSMVRSLRGNVPALRARALAVSSDSANEATAGRSETGTASMRRSRRPAASRSA